MITYLPKLPHALARSSFLFKRKHATVGGGGGGGGEPA